MDLSLPLNIWTIGLPIPVALAVVALLGYFVSKGSPSTVARREQHRYDFEIEETLNRMFALLARYGTGFSVAVFEIDLFDSIKAEQGQHYGDYMLQQVDRVVRQCARDTDNVARYAGEKFLVLMPHTDAVGAAVFADRTRSAVANQLTVTVSGGVTTVFDGDTPKSLMTRVHAALETAKGVGRSAVAQHLGDRAEPIGG